MTFHLQHTSQKFRRGKFYDDKNISSCVVFTTYNKLNDQDCVISAFSAPALLSQVWIFSYLVDRQFHIHSG